MYGLCVQWLHSHLVIFKHCLDHDSVIKPLATIPLGSSIDLISIPSQPSAHCSSYPQLQAGITLQHLASVVPLLSSFLPWGFSDTTAWATVERLQLPHVHTWKYMDLAPRNTLDQGERGATRSLLRHSPHGSSEGPMGLSLSCHSRD